MKRRLVKSIICGLMLATVLGSAAYAETTNYNRYGYNINNQAIAKLANARSQS